MRIPFIDLEVQQKRLKTKIQQRIDAVLSHGRYIMGPEVTELETALQNWCGAKHCITVGSGTEALLISLMALDVCPGDEVITTPFTFAATAEVIVLLGCIPVFVDIELDTCNIDAELIERAITDRTRAIIPVSLYGQPADMIRINEIADKYNLTVIEDAAQSFGSEYKGGKSGNLSQVACTSFFPSKPLGCYGDGGAIFTSNDGIAEAAKQIRVHGQSARYNHDRIGICGRMDTLQCAIVLAKLEQFDWELKQRFKIGARYNNLLDKAGIRRVVQRGDRSTTFAQYTIFVDNRDEIVVALAEANIPTAIHYPKPLNEQHAFMNCCINARPDQRSRLSHPNANYASAHVLSLPMGPDLDELTQDRIVSALKYAVHQ